jgi:hypothetical protein
MPSIIDAAAILAVIGAVFYYQGWLFSWHLRRQYAVHFAEIDSPRELLFVIGAWAFGWYPYYFFFIASVLAFNIVDQVASGKIWSTSAFAVVAAVCFYLFHRLAFIRARTVFEVSAREGFAFFPKLVDLCLKHEAEHEQLDRLKSVISENEFRVLSRDSKNVLLFCFRPGGNNDNQVVEVIEVPVSGIVALRVSGESQFANFISSSGTFPWKWLLPWS